jgi:CheY-like chemotaxis protein
VAYIKYPIVMSRPPCLYCVGLPRPEGEMAKTILVADDSPKMRELLCSLFEPEEDYEICAEAANGREAIDLALKHRPDLVILDLSMPGMDGLTVARELRTALPELPIIMFTHHADLGRHLPGCHLLVDRIVSKSEVGELLGHVRSLIPV